MMELEQRIRKELEENPVLDEVPSEEDDDTNSNLSLSDYTSDDSIPSYKLRNTLSGKDERPQYSTFSVRESFNQSLMSQLGYRQLDSRTKAIASFLIGSIDGDGYLRRNLDSLVDDISFRLQIETDEEELEQILSIIQEFEPIGVGARDLRESLLIQLNHKESTQARELALKILKDHFTEFTKKHYQKIMSRLSVDKDSLRDAIEEIVKLNPKPGGEIDDSYNEQAQQVVPDFLLEYKDGELIISMPRFNIPELRVNRRYAEMLTKSVNNTKPDKEATLFIKQKLDSARWFVEAIRQRHNTLSSTMRAIVDFQHDFFIDGDETKLKPMVLRNIAEITNLDISTISRVVSSKYIQTHFGVYSLKYFFSEGLMTESGEEVSTREIKKILSDSVEKEDKKRPFTDEELVKLLNEKGYIVARRTVAKYREQLSIPIARLRKEL